MLCCARSGSFGKLGHGEPVDESTPRQLQAMNGRNVTQVACGYAHSTALCDNHEVLAWGSGWKGKLGLGDHQNRLTPSLISSLKRKHLQQIQCGSFHTLALSEGGDVSTATRTVTRRRRAAPLLVLHRRMPLQVYSWGVGERGQLGHGDLENRKMPTPLLGLQGFEIGCIAAGETHSLCASRDGTKVWAWGGGIYGQLGVGGREQRLSPDLVEDLEGRGVTQVRSRLLGGTSRREVSPSSRVRQVACGANHSGAVTGGAQGAGLVFLWGNLIAPPHSTSS